MCRKLTKDVVSDITKENVVSYHNIVIPEPHVLPLTNENIDDNNQDVSWLPDPKKKLLRNISNLFYKTLQQDIFDVTDLQDEFGDAEYNSKSLYGSLEVAFAYDAPMRKMTIHVLQGRDIPGKDRGGVTNTQVMFPITCNFFAIP